ncbi:hypothetical protein BIW11_11055 [Tropilaelaps mercedesae]|uniref:Uncharacterized protein n=1 Tax=Tropilaelaps mercedesae TaxID=418985 RepID=A0A1V9XD66_9ACAR|nr:hypothetical protein BIW11_11055 [Tropilaelaps mercedesae]
MQCEEGSLLTQIAQEGRKKLEAGTASTKPSPTSATVRRTGTFTKDDDISGRVARRVLFVCWRLKWPVRVDFSPTAGFDRGPRPLERFLCQIGGPVLGEERTEARPA